MTGAAIDLAAALFEASQAPPGTSVPPYVGPPGSITPGASGVFIDGIPIELWTELGNVAGFQFFPPDTPLNTGPDRDPTNGRADNSDSFIDDVLGFLGDVLSALIFPIKQIATWIWDGIRDAAQWAWNFASDVWHSVVDIFHKLWDAISSQVAAIISTISDLVGEAWSLATKAADWIVNQGEWLWNKLQSLGQLILDGITGAIGWIWENLIQPVTDLIGSLFGTLWDAFWAAASWVWDKVQAIAEAVVNGVLDAASWLWDKVKAVAEAVAQAVVDALGVAWDILKAAWDWIVWMAEHTFQWFEDLFSLSYQGVGGAWINGITNALLADGDVVEELIAGWIG